MKAIFSILIVFSFLYFPLYAQFDKGYIINNNNDTVTGYIEIKKLNSNCTFKLGLDSAARVYFADDIKAFRFLEGKYFSAFCINPEAGSEKVFLEWLIKGKTSILKYTPSIKEVKSFILLENNSLHELKNTSEVREKNGSTYNIDKKEYIGVLSFYFKDCPQIVTKINKASFTSKSLIGIAKIYNEETFPNEEYVIFKNTNTKIKYDVGLTFSTYSSQLKLNNGIPEKVYLTNTLGFGFLLNVSNFLPRFSKLSAQAQVLYFKTLYKYDTKDLYWGDDNRICQLSIIRIPIKLNYRLFSGKLSPLISSGITTNIRFNYNQYNQFLMNYLTNHYDYIYEVSPFQFGVNFSPGLEYLINPDIGINIRFEYEHMFGFFNTLTHDESFTNNYLFQLSLLYKLNNLR